MHVAVLSSLLKPSGESFIPAKEPLRRQGLGKRAEDFLPTEARGPDQACPRVQPM